MKRLKKGTLAGPRDHASRKVGADPSPGLVTASPTNQPSREDAGPTKDLLTAKEVAPATTEESSAASETAASMAVLTRTTATVADTVEQLELHAGETQESLEKATSDLEVSIEAALRTKDLADDLKQALGEQRTATENVARISADKSDLVSVVSHEFRNALTGISGYAELLQEEELQPGDVHDFAGEIRDGADRMNRMIEDLLDQGSMESGRMRFDLKAVALNAMVIRTCVAAQRGALSHTIGYEVDPSVHEVRADPDMLTRVFANLLSNAIKYSPAGGEIRVTTSLQGDRVEVSVTDHGLGIPEEALETVFERYSRVDSGGAEDIKGTGLGLPIVRHLIELHGGSIRVESKLGEGSRFIFEIPIAGPAEAHLHAD